MEENLILMQKSNEYTGVVSTYFTDNRIKLQCLAGYKQLSAVQNTKGIFVFNHYQPYANKKVNIHFIPDTVEIKTALIMMLFHNSKQKYYTLNREIKHV